MTSILKKTLFAATVSLCALTSFAEGKVLYSVDFSNVSAADPRAWLKDNGFTKIQSDASNQNKLALSFNKTSLVLDTKSKIFGLILNPSLHLENAKTIRITWGVDSFPDGASYDKGVRNEALMVYVYFGDNDQDSGSIFIPNCPYFIGMFLSKDDPLDKFFIGRHFSTGGRFVCLGNPKPSETVVSEYNLSEGFLKAFPNAGPVPFISGIALEVETSSTGHAKGFINKIEILD